MSVVTLTGCMALIGPEARITEAPVDIEIRGNRIAEVRPAGLAAAKGEIIDATQRLATPGMINGHFHSHEHFHKGRYDNVPLELWMNYVRPTTPLPWTARQVYLRTMVGAIEALRSGTTTVCDDMNISPVLNRDHVDAALQAYEDIGIRANLGISLFDKPFFQGMPFVEEEFPAELVQRLNAPGATSPEEVLEFARGLARSRHPKDKRVAYIAAPSAPQRCTEEFLLAVRRLADEFDLPLMMHVQETRLQVVTGQILFGSTMIEYLDRIGVLKPRTALIHAIWLTPREIEILARSGATVQHNPICNLKMGSGIAPMAALLKAGVNVSLGTDGCGSVETTDMQKTLSAAALLPKIRGDDPAGWSGAEEAWTAATRGGAVALGRDDELGAIAPGMIADISLWRLDHISFRPLNDALRQLVYAGSGASLDTVLVDGVVVLRGGELVCIDEAAILDEIAEAHEVLAPLIAASEQEAGPILAVYKRIIERCRRHEIAPDTYPALLPGGTP